MYGIWYLSDKICIAPATSMQSCSLSTTHGPDIKKKFPLFVCFSFDKFGSIVSSFVVKKMVGCQKNYSKCASAMFSTAV